MIQDGIGMNLGEPSISYKEVSMANTSQQRQGLLDEWGVVGLVDSTLSLGKPCTWGSGQQWDGKLSTTCLMNTQRFIVR